MKTIENTNNTYFERFAFGDNPEMADELLALVLSGKKTATVSVVLENEQAPSVGDLSLVLDGHGDPACVIKTVYLETIKFCDLTWDMVKLEGEDETFEQWKAGNIRYWTRDAAKRSYTFTEQTPITYERFEVVEVFNN
ncbi:MAG: ASCH domain-containing protein [Clostridia bacterium]|nr:ASCH domain-containing protein [Clostridia bacterium]